MINESLKNQIIIELINKKKIKLCEHINYGKFCELYKDYNYLKEFFFAEILGISYNSLKVFKSPLGNEKTIILKNFDYNLIKPKESIIEELIDKKLIEYNKRINYDYFCYLWNFYPYLTEKNMADVLEIKYSTLITLKYKRTRNMVILKRKFVLTNDEEKIIDELINTKQIYPGMSIDYDKFNDLRRNHPNISEQRFAYMLELTTAQFKKIYYKYGNSIILKSKMEEFTKKNANKIIDELKRTRNLKERESINKERFYELYNGYEYFDEVYFAEYMLEIDTNNFKNMKYSNSKALALKNHKELSEEEINEYFNQIINAFDLEEATLINYETFKKIHKYFSNLLEDELRYILGISTPSFDGFKYSGKEAYIHNGLIRERMCFIKREFLEIRFYNINEINDVLKKYKVTLKYFIIYIVNNGKFWNTEDYENAINKNGGIFLGKTTTTHNFIKDNYNILLKYIKFIILEFKRKNIIIEDEDDFIQNAFIYIYEKCGDLEFNFGICKDLFLKIEFRLKKYLIGQIYDNKSQSEIYINDFKNKNLILKDDNNMINFQDENNNDNNIYNIAIKLTEYGYSLDETIDILSNKFKKEKSEILEEIKSYISSSKIYNLEYTN